MKSSILGAILATSAAGSALPPMELVRISKRNVCDGVDATPVLYHEYRGDSCPPIHTMDGNGECPGLDATGNNCASFCQIRK